MTHFLIRSATIIGLFLTLLSTKGAIALAAEFQYPSLLKQTSSQLFEHWNTEKNKITGYTHISYYKEKSDDKEYLIELSQNRNRNQEVFSEKRIWFFANSGKTVRYLEEDFREKVKTENLYRKERIDTLIKSPKGQKSFRIENSSHLLPFELLSFALRAQISELLKEETLRFDLYLPLLTMELKEKGFPTSFSTLEMEAIVKNLETKKTAFGTKPCVEIKIQPTSFLLKAILPKEKSEFWITFLKDPPYQLIRFKEGVTESRLIKIGK